MTSGPCALSARIVRERSGIGGISEDEVGSLRSHVDKAAVTWGNRSAEEVSSWWALCYYSYQPDPNSSPSCRTIQVCF